MPEWKEYTKNNIPNYHWYWLCGFIARPGGKKHGYERVIACVYVEKTNDRWWIEHGFNYITHYRGPIDNPGLPGEA